MCRVTQAERRSRAEPRAAGKRLRAGCRFHRGDPSRSDSGLRLDSVRKEFAEPRICRHLQSCCDRTRTDNDILLLNSDVATTRGFLEELSAVPYLSPLHGIVCCDFGRYGTFLTAGGA